MFCPPGILAHLKHGTSRCVDGIGVCVSVIGNTYTLCVSVLAKYYNTYLLYMYKPKSFPFVARSKETVLIHTKSPNVELDCLIHRFSES